jgi:hypothetical protein
MDTKIEELLPSIEPLTAEVTAGFGNFMAPINALINQLGLGEPVLGERREV